MSDTYTIEQGIAAQRALRRALGMGEEAVRPDAFVRMLGDEIDAHRDAGRSWQDIAATIADAGAEIDAAAIERLHGRGGGRDG